MLVTIIAARWMSYYHGLLTPLYINRQRLRSWGISFKVVTDHRAARDSDAVLVISRYFASAIAAEEHDAIIEALDAIRRRNVGQLLWFDAADSSGTTQFYVVPHVDQYVKSSLLRDRIAYTRSFYGDTVFTDFYHSRFGISDSGPQRNRPTLSRQHLVKLSLGWNIGLADLGRWARHRYFVGRFLPIPHVYSSRFVPVDRPRRTDISMRLGTTHARETVAFQRRITANMLAKRGVPVGKVSRSSYLRELGESKICVSPFGWGEICYRDFEAFSSGCMLLKPDMAHLETWPDFYRPGESYLPFAWDFADIDQALDNAFAHEHWRAIAARAQQLYRHYLFDEAGRMEFCLRLARLVGCDAPRCEARSGP